MLKNINLFGCSIIVNYQMKSRIIEDKIVPGYTVIHCETFKFDFNKLKEFILIYSPDLLHCGDYF